MNIENGKAVFERVTCWDCSGTRVVTRNQLCPNWNKPQKGKACPHCGSKTKHGHQTVGEHQTNCSRCDLEGKIQEDRFSHIPSDWWKDYALNKVKIEVTRINRGQTFNEAYLGIGVIGSCTDYGELWNLSDEQIEAQKHHLLASHSPVQYVGIVDKENNVANSFTLVVKNQGYHFEQKKS